MQAASALHKAIFRDPGHWAEHKAVIAGVEYLPPDILSLRTSGGAFAAPDIGNCASRQLDLTLRRVLGTIPKRAKIQVYTRLANETQTAEWLPKGVFYVSTRQTDKLTGALAIHGYDAMRKAGAVWDIDPAASWPMSARAAAEDIARRMGVAIDPRTVLSGAFPVDYPVDSATATSSGRAELNRAQPLDAAVARSVDENGDLTMEDVLSGIAAGEAGNWVMSDEGKLLLLRFGDIPPETWYLVDEYGDAITFGGDRILVR